jgi:hypothetical protein
VIEAEASDHQGFAEAKEITDPFMIFVYGLKIKIVLREDAGREAASLKSVFKPAAKNRAGNRKADGMRVG